MLDRFVHGQVTRLSPEAPVPVLTVSGHEDVPGGSANVAVNCRALGREVRLFGLVGQDAEATILTDALESKGIRTRLFPTAAPTILKTRLIDGRRHLFRFDLEQRFVPGDAAALARAVFAELNEAGAVLLSDYAKGTLAEPQAYIRAARSAGLRICVDPKHVPFDRYFGAHVLTPNAIEFEAATGTIVGGSGFNDIAAALCASLSLEALLVKAGNRGMYLIQPYKPVRHIEARPVVAVDVTGAGDVVLAVLSDGLARGLSYEDAAVRANSAGAISVTRRGTGVVANHELD